MSYRIEQPLPAWRHIDFASVAGLLMASAGLVALIVEVNIRGWWGLATSWVDMLALVVWLSLSVWLSGWALQNAEGWWHVPSFLGVVVSVIGVAFLLVLALMSLVSEHPDVLIDDSKQKRKGSRNRRRRTRSSGRLPNAPGALTGVGRWVLLATASVAMLLAGRFVDWSAAVMLLTGWVVDFGAWAGEVLGDLVVGWLAQQTQ